MFCIKILFNVNGKATHSVTQPLLVTSTMKCWLVCVNFGHWKNSLTLGTTSMQEMKNNASSSVKWASFSCQISKGTLKTLQTNEGRRWGGRVQGMIQANEYNYCSIWHRSMQFFIIVNRKMSTNAFWYASRLKIWMKIPQFQDV